MPSSRSWRLVGLSVALGIAASCGTDQPSSSGEASATTSDNADVNSPAANATTDIEPGTTDTEQSNDHPEESSCGLADLLASVGYLATGVSTFSDEMVIRKDETWGGELSYREMAFEPETVVATKGGSTGFEDGGATNFIVLNAITYGANDVVIYPDLGLSADGASITGLFEDFQSDVGVRLRLRALLAPDSRGELRFVADDCAEYNNAELAILEDRLGIGSTEVLTQWIRADADPESGESDLALELEAARADGRTASLDASWRATHATERSLRPADVPRDVLPTLEVRAVIVGSGVIGDGQYLTIRSDSGVSSIAYSEALPAVLPVYFADGDEAVELLASSYPQDAKAAVIARIPTSILSSYAGGVELLRDQGSYTLAERDFGAVAQALDLSVEELEGLRDSLLQP